MMTQLKAIGILVIVFVLNGVTLFAETREQGSLIFAQVKRQMGRAQSKSEVKAALEKYIQATVIFKRVGNHQGLGAVLHSIGNICCLWGEYDKALKYYEASLGMSVENSDLKGQAYSLNSIGQVYQDLGEYNKALQYCQKSLAIRLRIGHSRGQAHSYQSIGNIHFGMGHYAKALEYFQRSLTIFQRAKDLGNEGVCVGFIGRIHYAKGNYNKALQCFEESLAKSVMVHREPPDLVFE